MANGVAADTMGSAVTQEHIVTHHTIRLRGAWVCTADGDRTCHSRNFGWPKPLAANEQLWLVCTHVPTSADVFLNGTLAAGSVAAGAFMLEITPAVQPRNTVMFAVTTPEPLGDVTLEVRSQLG